MGTPQHLVLMLKNLYKNSKAMVRVEDRNSKPSVFYHPCYSTSMEESSGWLGGRYIGGKKINNLR